VAPKQGGPKVRVRALKKQAPILRAYYRKAWFQLAPVEVAEEEEARTGQAPRPMWNCRWAQERD
jgi:hypothetical protein